MVNLCKENGLGVENVVTGLQFGWEMSLAENAALLNNGWWEKMSFWYKAIRTIISLEQKHGKLTPGTQMAESLRIPRWIDGGLKRNKF